MQQIIGTKEDSTMALQHIAHIFEQVLLNEIKKIAPSLLIKTMP